MPAENNYSQLDKEALAIICAVKRFYQYIYCRKLKILTDHKPVIGLVGQNKVTPRMQRWCLSRSAYDYVLELRAEI